MHILIADDDPVARRLLRGHLIALGATVREADDGVTAWGAIQVDTIQMVITDWMMPQMDGVELIRRIRAAQFPHYIYVVLLTARDSKAEVVAGLDAGADDYLTKPFDPHELRARVAIGTRIINLETRLREARDQMERFATIDTLTGLFNRRAINAYAEAELARAARAETAVSLVLLDVDHFKTINDRYGHHVGDLALQHVAQIVQDHLRPYDGVGRWGGEELLLVVPVPADDALALAERVRRLIAEQHLVLEGGEQLQMTASIGVTTWSGTPLPLEVLVRQADHALYQAKHEGRNRVCQAEPGEVRSKK
jgi:two-component system chemotaxis response regulator CheY